jgi:hypothetical protein
VNRLPENSRALAMYYAHPKDPFFSAQSQVIGNQVPDLPGTEGVKVKNPVYGYLNGLIPAIHFIWWALIL